ncbi:MAG TPA: alpha-hydroxy acid oxidase [Acidimicrobiia bacterium]|nr:alpha-hydroxy acid oxidase [Acidimicrobiia bacterium]
MRSPSKGNSLRSTVRMFLVGPPQLRPAQRRLRRSVTVADLRSIARRRLPGGVFDYIDGGAEDELTLAANIHAYRRVTFRPRVLRDVGEVDISASLLGKPLSLPLVLAPTGFTRIADPAGELAVARAAERAGVPYALSTLGTRSIEEVAAVNTSRLWFQVYVWRDRALVADLVQRAAASGYEALCLTVDTAVFGRRERDVRRGFTLPPKLGLSTALDGIVHPGWTWQFLRSEPIVFANVTGRAVGDGANAVTLADYVARQFDPGLSWKDVEWLRGQWSGPIVIKGIQTVDDARIAADAGVEAIAISNHGGRQLDSAPAALDLVPEIAEAVGDRIEIICDGGVRRGSDIVKALALGANACMAGRAYLYGLGAAGEAGVDHVLDMFSFDMKRTMALIGCTTIKEVNRDFVTFER